MTDLIKLPTLLRGQWSSLSLTFNDHHCNYETAAQAEEDNRALWNWVSEDEKEKALATDSVWCLHWYPDTPVGFYSVTASSLEALLAGVYAKEAAGEFQG